MDDWCRAIRAFYPYFLKQTYFIPPLQFNRVPFTDLPDPSATPPNLSKLRKKNRPVAITDHPSSGTPLPKPLFSALPSSPTRVEDSAIRSDACLSLLRDCLRVLAKDQVMMVICELQFRNYLDGQTDPINRAHCELFCHPADLDRDGDFDILILHRTYGLVTAEVKSVGAEPSIIIMDRAVMTDRAMMTDRAVMDRAVMTDREVMDRAVMTDREVTDRAVMTDRAVIMDRVVMTDRAVMTDREVTDRAVMTDRAVIMDRVVMTDKAVMTDRAVMADRAVMMDKAVMTDRVVMMDRVVVTDKVVMTDRAVVTDKPVVTEKTVVKRVSESIAQLNKATTVLHHLVSGLTPTPIRVTRCLMMPYITSQQLSRAIATDHGVSKVSGCGGVLVSRSRPVSYRQVTYITHGIYRGSCHQSTKKPII